MNVNHTRDGQLEKRRSEYQMRLSKLFTPMFTTKANGQGFGLPVFKRLVKAQGGSISFESQVGK